ncbi:MAG TPA: alpha/beta hydrolase, partial [Steroidobacteraceae bacterium]|nr:alpha/beta hydrolase [Steroidobacteraceae bacterium]
MPSLLLLSGLLCDETVWADAAHELASAADVRIVSFAGFDSIQVMAEYVLRLAPQQFLVAGHSMGGRVALEIFRLAKERVLGLSLLDSGVHPLRPGEIESRGRLLKLA